MLCEPRDDERHEDAYGDLEEALKEITL
jgi:hypothetical protein